MAAFRTAAISERTTRLAYVGDVLSREVSSVNDITEEEGRKVLDRLRADFPQAKEDDGDR
jgi:hypothetical protein